MKILDYLNINENFKYSINLGFDMFKSDKINGFIATRTSVEILYEMLNEIINTNGQPQLFIGPYGKGKSHLLLVLIELLSGQDKRVQKDLINKLIDAKPEIKERLSSVSKKRYLPIIMTGGYEDFSRNMIQRIKEQLSEYGISDIRIVSSFDKAISVLEKYELDKGSNDVTSRLKSGLKSRDDESYKEFLEFYKKVTFGVEFTPMLDLNIISIIKGVNEHIKNNTEFDGLLLVLDEFSKFLEGSAAANSLNDIQDIAEYSASEENVSLICVTHKRIAEYISEADNNSNANEWKKIEARFRHQYFGLFEDEYYYYNLIAEVINKDAAIFDYPQVSKYLKVAVTHVQSLSFLTIDENKDALLSKGVYPLTPLSAYSLVKLSEKIAQNERTLFTFLCGNEVKGLRNILNTNIDQVVNVDSIYDYFEPLYEDNKANAIYKIYLKARSVLDKCKTEDEIKVVKVIAVLNFINDFKNLMPTRDTIQRCLCNVNVSESINRLVNENLILKKSNNNSYTFFSGSGQNISLRINNLVNQKYHKIDISRALNEVLDAYYVVPTAYNHQFKITRFFKYVFIKDSIFLNDNFMVEKFLETVEADGYVVAIISDKKNDSDEVVETIKQRYNNDDILFLSINEKSNSTDLVRQVYAIEELLNDKKLIKEDAYLKTELQMLRREYLDELKSYWEKVIYEGDAKYIYKKTFLNISNYRMLTQEIGSICQSIYSNYPVLNYELLNKNKLSSAIVKARKYVIEKILNPNYDISTLRDTSSEKTIYRVVVENSQKELEADSNLSKVIKHIQDLIQSSYMNELTVKTIYDELISAPFGVRKGVLPIYLTIVFNLFKHELVISSSGQEVPLSVQTIQLMSDDPASFSISITKTTKEINNYIKKLGLFFDVDFNSNLFVNDYILVANGIKTFLNSLPDYSTSFTSTFDGNKRVQMESTHKKVINEFLQYKINPSDLLLKKIPLKYYKGKKYSEIIDAFTSMKNILNEHVVNEKIYLKKFMLDNLCDRYSGSLKAGLTYRLSQLKDEDYKIANNKKLNDLKRLSNNFSSHDDLEFVQEVSRVLVGLAIEDYGSTMMQKATDSIVEISSLIENLKTEGKDATKRNQIAMQLNSKNYEAYVEERPLPVAGNMIINELSDILDESFDDEIDKQNIIMHLLKNYM